MTEQNVGYDYVSSFHIISFYGFVDKSLEGNAPKC